MKRKKLLITFSVILLIVVCPIFSLLLLTKAQFTRASRQAPVYIAKDQHGKLWKSESLKGQTRLIAFIPDSCDEECENILSTFREFAAEIKNKNEPNFIIHTIQPDTGTVYPLKPGDILPDGDDRWFLLYLKRNDLELLVVHGFMGKIMSGAGYLETDPKIVLVSREGYLRGYYPV